MDDLRYPTGTFEPSPEPLTPEQRDHLIDRIAALPAELRAAAEGLDDDQLDTPYRDEGWSPRQIVHHVADSHLNSIVRFKLALTMHEPTIQPYDQDRWARLGDVRDVPTAASLGILDGLHERWVRLLRSLADDQWSTALNHPEIGRIDLDFLLQLYAWHGHHHATQIVRLRERQGW